jgi:hypothetical protein
VQYRKLKEKQNLRRGKCVAGQLHTVKTVGRMIMLDKTNQGGVLHMEREATGPIAVQIPNNQR